MPNALNQVTITQVARMPSRTPTPLLTHRQIVFVLGIGTEYEQQPITPSQLTVLAVDVGGAERIVAEGAATDAGGAGGRQWLLIYDFNNHNHRTLLQLKLDW